jgi:NAD-dependent DNA ligase
VRELHAAWQHGDLYSLLPTDGIVATVNDPTQRRLLGVTSVAPRYALALK